MGVDEAYALRAGVPGRLTWPLPGELTPSPSSARPPWSQAADEPDATPAEEDAFARLRRASQVSGRPMKVVAEALIATFGQPS